MERFLPALTFEMKFAEEDDVWCMEDDAYPILDS